MGDFLGYVCVRVDRSKPLCEVPEVYLDRVAVPGSVPLGWIGCLYLEPPGRLVFFGRSGTPIGLRIPIAEVLTAK